MSFAPLLSPESPSYTFVKSSISFLAAFCSSILAAATAWIDDLAPEIPPSWCLACKFNNQRHSHVRTEAEKIGPPSDCGTGSYTLKKLEDTDGAPTTIAIVFNPRTKTYSLKKLEDIDVEKAIFRDSLPSSAASVKVQLPGATTKLLSEILHLGDETPPPPRRTRRRLKHQPSLVDGIFIIPGRSNRAGTRSTTMRKSTYTPPESHQQLLPVELPATPPFGSVRRKHHPTHLPQSPVELAADEIAPVPVLLPPPPRAVLATPPPRLMVPRPRSRRSCMASPLLALPPSPLPPPAAAPTTFLGIESLERRPSSAGSVGSESIQIAYMPSH